MTIFLVSLGVVWTLAFAALVEAVKQIAGAVQSMAILQRVVMEEMNSKKTLQPLDRPVGENEMPNDLERYGISVSGGGVINGGDSYHIDFKAPDNQGGDAYHVDSSAPDLPDHSA